MPDCGDTLVKDMFRQIPSVDELLSRPSMQALAARYGHRQTVEATRAVLSQLRADIAGGRAHSVSTEKLEDQIAVVLARATQFSLRSVINATGVILHTNLGRAPLAREALEHVAETAGQYCNLEYDLESGVRGRRDVHTERLFSQLLGAEATLVVNNNAAAVLLALNTLAEGGEVIISRGELIEIGESFRIPEIMACSGALLREVGTTNRTRLSDYADAINERTRLVLRVHPSNFRIVGFTERPSLEELVGLGRERSLPIMEDLGSGCLLELPPLTEPPATASLRAGADVVTFSGDKLLGGPQAGIVVGRQTLLDRLRKNPLYRALRIDKLMIAALEATVALYLRGDSQAIPTLRMVKLTPDAIKKRASYIAERLNGPAGFTAAVEDRKSVV